MIKNIVIYLSLGIILTGTVVGANSLANKGQTMEQENPQSDKFNADCQMIDEGGLYGDDSEVVYPMIIKKKKFLLNVNSEIIKGLLFCSPFI
jgi:hypothetical protein